MQSKLEKTGAYYCYIFNQYAATSMKKPKQDNLVSDFC